ncbi:MAG: phytanoyl-CoA dioxygenase family protein [Candidatus Poribacteria bacterium]
MPTELTVTVEDIEFFADNVDVQRAAETFKEHGCLVVRGLMKPYIKDIHRDIEAAAAESIALLDDAQKIVEGWRTPNGTLFLPAPPGYKRDKQIMVLAVNHYTSAAFFRSAFDERAIDIVEAIVGPNIEMFGNGQCLYKEPIGGHPKHLHQDSAYFEHRYQGPVGLLNYVVDTDLVNGALHVVPGSHRMGQLKHIDTFSHLGLDDTQWPWERALPIVGEAGDSIFSTSRRSTALNRICQTNHVRFSSTDTVERMTTLLSVEQQPRIAPKRKSVPLKQIKGISVD